MRIFFTKIVRPEEMYSAVSKGPSIALLGLTFKTLLLTSLLLSTNSCVTVATSGAQAVYNHQSLQKSAHDQYVTVRAYQAIDIDSDHFRNANINISTFNRVVLLSGQAPTRAQKHEAEQLVKKIAGSDPVYNLITIEKPAPPLARLNDAWLTAKIKAKFLASNDVDASEIKVVTENQRVYLMGVLRPKAAQAAVRTASQTEGVRAVVKVFSYLNLSKTPAEG